MPTDSDVSKPSWLFWTVGWIGLAWNAIGIMTFLMSATLSQEALEAMAPAERALHTDVPTLVMWAYAIAVFGGTLACALLLLRKTLAIAAFSISLGAILIQMAHALLFTPMLDVLGASAGILPVMIIAIAAYVLWYAMRANKRCWLH